MTVTNDPQLVPPESTNIIVKKKRPLWVTALAIVFFLIAIIGACGEIQKVTQFGSIDWARSAQQLDMAENTLKSMTYLQTYGALALCVVIAALCVGIWKMKKWGAVISWVMAGISILAIIMTLVLAGPKDPITMIIFGLFVIIGVGQIFLWRNGSLT
jgi:hypothetical protein